MMTQKCGTFVINPGRMFAQGGNFGSFSCRTVEITINLQTMVRCTIAIWGSFCDETVDPCATCGGNCYHACEKGLSAGCGSGMTYGRLT